VELIATAETPSATAVFDHAQAPSHIRQPVGRLVLCRGARRALTTSVHFSILDPNLLSTARGKGEVFQARQFGDFLARLSNSFLLVALGVSDGVVPQTSHRAVTRAAIQILHRLEPERVRVKGIGELHVIVITILGVVEVINQRKALPSQFFLSHALHAKPFQLGLEIVEHDCIGEALKDQAEFPPGVDPISATRETVDACKDLSSAVHKAALWYRSR